MEEKEISNLGVEVGTELTFAQVQEILRKRREAGELEEAAPVDKPTPKKSSKKQ